MSGFVGVPNFPWPKNATDINDWTVDFTGPMQVGDTIATIASTAVSCVNETSPALTVVSTAIQAGTGGTATAVMLRLSGGTLSLLYLISISITTTKGDSLTRSVYLQMAGM